MIPSVQSSLGQACVAFSHGFSSQMYLVGVVDEAIQDGIGQGRIIDEFMPVIDRELAGNQGGVHTVAVVQQFE